MLTGSLHQYIASPQGKKELNQLYQDGTPHAVERIDRLLDKFIKLYGEQETVIVSSPGRTELGGNHTDHQNGCVLCAAVRDDIVCAASPRSDGIVCLDCGPLGEILTDLHSLEPSSSEVNSTSALIRGMASMFHSLGYFIGGFNGVLTSDLVPGEGFSSSAAFEILVGEVFNALYNVHCPVSPLLLAQMAQKAENIWFGKPSGLMDQCACALGGVLYLDFYDPTCPIYRKMDTDFSRYGYTLGTISVGSSHEGLSAEYAAISHDMRRVAAEFGKTHLRYVSEADFCNSISSLYEKVTATAIDRAKHFFAETRRAFAMAEAFDNGDISLYQKLMQCSGDSSEYLLRNIVPQSRPEEKRLAEALCFCREHLSTQDAAFRVHGGGFGGAVQVLMPENRWEAFSQKAESVFGGSSCKKLIIRPQGGHIITGE